MFFREKKSKDHAYIQIVENKWVDGRSKQSVIATLGRKEQLQLSGQLDDLLTSGSKFADKILVLNSHRQGNVHESSKLRIGGSLIFERLWHESGLPDIIRDLLGNRKFEFDVERTIFTTILHRLFDPGSDRSCEKWMRNYSIKDAQELQLHHFYRAMAWLGEELEETDAKGESFSPRCTKDLIEERLFQKRSNLYTSIDMMFFDTTSIYFEGEGGETIGQYGHSKDHRPDLKQMVVGAVLDDSGYPVCCELWPGNMTDVSSLTPVTERLRERFNVRQSCIVADRGMISADTIKWLEDKKHPWQYILGARMRKQKEVTSEVLSRAGRYEVVNEKSRNPKDPSPLKVKEVWVENKRYIVCHNEDQAKKDQFDRQAILASLQESLKNGSKSLVGNKGYKKYLRTVGAGFEIDERLVKEDSKFDGKWVLRTNTGLPASEVAMKYKQLWMVEKLFRSLKSILETRPIFHKCNETIRGHVFCSFLAMVLTKELQDRLTKKGDALEWNDVIRDLDNIEEIQLEQNGKHYVIRVGAGGCSGKVFQAAGVAMPPQVKNLEK